MSAIQQSVQYNNDKFSCNLLQREKLLPRNGCPSARTQRFDLHLGELER